MGYGWGRRRRGGFYSEPEPSAPGYREAQWLPPYAQPGAPVPEPFRPLAEFYPPPPILWAIPPWESLPRDIKLEILRAQKQWLEAIKKIIEEQIKSIEEEIEALERGGSEREG